MTPVQIICICNTSFGIIRLRNMRNKTQCLQHPASVVNSSAVSASGLPFTQYERVLFLREHLNVLEERLNTTISDSLLCLSLYLL